jgi:predicted DNA-binding transcriptional regulator YafY
MRYPGTRPLVRRMQAIDQALRARKWPTDKTLAKDLEVDPRTIRRDLEFMRDEHHAPIAFEGATTIRSRRNVSLAPASDEPGRAARPLPA